MTEANDYLAKVYRPAFNEELAQPPLEEGSAFVDWIGAHLDDVLCEHHERTVQKDNCVHFDRLILQIPQDKHRHHYMKVKVKVYRYLDGTLAIFHGPRRLANYDGLGKLIEDRKKTVA